MSTLNLIRRRPAFRTLWLGEIVTQLGDWLSYVAISLLAMHHGPGHGALAVALVIVAHSLPHAVLAPLAGPVADRFDRRTILLLTHIGQASLTVGMILCIDSLVLVQLLLVIRTSLSALDWPARTAAVAQLVPEDELLTANALCAATWSMCFGLGMAVGGALALLGPVIALAIDAATFLVAAALVSGLPALPAPGRRSQRPAPLVDLLGHRPVIRAALAKTPPAIAGGAALVVLNLVSTEATFAGTAGLTLGLLQTVKAIGTGVGPAWIRARIQRGARLSHMWTLTVLTAFVGIGIFLAAERPALWLLGSWLWGVGSGSNWVLATTELQRCAPETHLGRLSSVDALSMTLGMSAAALGTGVAIEVTGNMGGAAWPAAIVAVGVWAVLWTLTSESTAPSPETTWHHSA